MRLPPRARHSRTKPKRTCRCYLRSGCRRKTSHKEVAHVKRHELRHLCSICVCVCVNSLLGHAYLLCIPRYSAVTRSQISTESSSKREFKSMAHQGMTLASDNEHIDKAMRMALAFVTTPQRAPPQATARACVPCRMLPSRLPQRSRERHRKLSQGHASHAALPHRLRKLAPGRPE